MNSLEKMASKIQIERSKESILPAAALRAPAATASASVSIDSRRDVLPKDRNPQPTDLNNKPKDDYLKIVIRNLAPDTTSEEFFDLIPGWISAERCMFHYYMPGKVASNKSKSDSPSTAYIGFISGEIAEKFRLSFMKNIAPTFSIVPIVEPAPYQEKVKIPFSDKPKESFKEDSYFAKFKQWLEDPSLPKPSPDARKPASSKSSKPASSGKSDGKAKSKKKNRNTVSDLLEKNDEERGPRDTSQLSKKVSRKERVLLKQQNKAPSNAHEAVEGKPATGNNASESEELSHEKVPANSKPSKRKQKAKEKQKEKQENSAAPPPASQQKKKSKKTKTSKPLNSESESADTLPTHLPSAVVDAATPSASSQPPESLKPEKKAKKTKKKPKPSKPSSDLNESEGKTQEGKKPVKSRKAKEKKTSEKQLNTDENQSTEPLKKTPETQGSDTQIKSS